MAHWLHEMGSEYMARVMHDAAGILNDPHLRVNSDGTGVRRITTFELGRLEMADDIRSGRIYPNER